MEIIISCKNVIITFWIASSCYSTLLKANTREESLFISGFICHIEKSFRKYNQDQLGTIILCNILLLVAHDLVSLRNILRESMYRLLDAATREPFMPFVGQINLGLSLPPLSQKLTEEWETDWNHLVMGWLMMIHTYTIRRTSCLQCALYSFPPDFLRLCGGGIYLLYLVPFH